MPSDPIATMLHLTGKSIDLALLADPKGCFVVEDIMREREDASSHRWVSKISAAHMRWLNLGPNVGPSPNESARTMFVVDASTTMESYPPHVDIELCLPAHEVNRAAFVQERSGDWRFWFTTARQVLARHPKADRIRVVRPEGTYKPAPGEVVTVRRKKRGQNFYIDEFCRVDGCEHRWPLAMSEQPLVARRRADEHTLSLFGAR